MDQSILQQTPEQIILFLQGKTPDVIQELFLWNTVSSFIWFILGLSLVIVFWALIIKNVKEGEAKNPSYADGSDIYQETWSHDVYGNMKTDIEGLCWISGILIHLISLLIISLSTDWIKILVAPKLYLFEYAISLIK